MDKPGAREMPSVFFIIISDSASPNQNPAELWLNTRVRRRIQNLYLIYFLKLPISFKFKFRYIAI